MLYVVTCVQPCRNVGVRVCKRAKTVLAHYNYSKFKHFVPLKCVVSVKHPFVEPRKSIEEVFSEVHIRSVFVFQKN